jgi:hypothetical protein
LRLDRAAGLIEVCFEGNGTKPERVSVDPTLLRANLQALKQYVAGLQGDPDEESAREDIALAETLTFSNIIHFSQMSGRAETIFGLFSFSDWVDATRESNLKVPEVESIDQVVAISSTGLQKKLILELIQAIGTNI